MKRKNRIFPWLLLAPALLVYLTFSIWPLIRSVSISFQHYQMESPEAPYWNGIANYRRIFDDPQLLHALGVSVTYTIFTVPIVVIVSLVCALALHGLGRRAVWFQPIIFLPMVVAPSIIAVIWFTILDGGRGALNWLLSTVGLHVDWLGPVWALPSVSLANAWGGIAFGTLLFVISLNAIPHELYEAAAVDGAGPLASFFAITLPGVAKALALLLLLASVGLMKDFTFPFIITRGGPASATETISYLIYRKAFLESPLDLGYACALSVVFALILAALSATLLRIRRRGL